MEDPLYSFLVLAHVSHHGLGFIPFFPAGFCLFKVNNKDTRMKLICCLYRQPWTDFTHGSAVSSIDSEMSVAQKMKFSIKDFFSKCNQICRKLRVWSHLLKKSLWKTSFFVQYGLMNLFLILLYYCWLLAHLLVFLFSAHIRCKVFFITCLISARKDCKQYLCIHIYI